MEKDLRRAKFSEVIRYGMGGVGSNVAFMLVMAYLMFFYTDIFGINAAAVGGLFLVSRFIDAVTDPLMGMIADRTKSKWGKYRPWIIFGAPLLGLNVVMLFTAPNLSPGGKLAYVYVTYIFYSLVSTVVNIPYHTLTPVLSEDPNQRTVIATTKQLLGQVGTSFVSIGAIPIVTALGGGKSAWQMYGIMCGVIMAISFFICAAGAKEHDNMEIHNKYEKFGEKFSLIEQLQLVFKNRALLMLMIAFGTDMFALAGASAVNVYYFTYAVKRPDLIAVVAMFGLFIGVPVTFFVPILSNKFGKKNIFMIASTVLMFLTASLFFIPYSAFNLILIQSAALAAISPFTGVVGWAILADCVEYGEWVTGKRGAGIISSQLTFINKMGMAFGGLAVGVMLQKVGYVAGAQQTPETLRAIVAIKGLFPAAGYLCSIVSMWFYPITKEFYYKMLEDNAKRRATAKTSLTAERDGVSVELNL
jgi:sugar (glycoside-pentoside-hexuronide) transporter